VSRGRPKLQAPKGRVTVREAAQILGVSESAVGGRIERGTLPAKEVPLAEQQAALLLAPRRDGGRS
jgi:hypothetical protein